MSQSTKVSICYACKRSKYSNKVKVSFKSFADLVKLYNHQQLDPDYGPQQLLNKVQFDIRFNLCCRGSENFHDMQKDFALEYNTETNIAFVCKVKDELTKNHKDLDIDVTSGFMT